MTIRDKLCPNVVMEPYVWHEHVWDNGPGWGPSVVARHGQRVDHEATHAKRWRNGQLFTQAVLALAELHADARMLAEHDGDTLHEPLARKTFRRNTILREQTLLRVGLRAECNARRQSYRRRQERERLARATDD